MKAKEVVVVNAKIPLTLKMAVKKYIERGLYMNFSDFLRECMREKLRRDKPLFNEALMTEPVENIEEEAEN